MALWVGQRPQHSDHVFKVVAAIDQELHVLAVEQLLNGRELFSELKPLCLL